MNKIGWMGKVVVVVGLAAVVGMTGCAKKKVAQAGGAGGVGGTGTDADNIGGVYGSDISTTGFDENGMPLSGRPGEGAIELDSSQFAKVYFDYDSSQVNESERPAIEAVASYLSSNPGVAVVVEGNTDERGSNEYNLALGERRALAVRAYLVGLGVDGNRVQTKSLGEEQPADVNHDESAWSQNRRGEFVVIQY